jgi:hypothetical protein
MITVMGGALTLLGNLLNASPLDGAPVDRNDIGIGVVVLGINLRSQ